MKRGVNFSAILYFTVTLVIFTLAITVMIHSLKEYHLGQIRQALQDISSEGIGWAIFTIIGNYFVFGIYDFAATRYIKRPLPFIKALKTSFLAYSIGNSTSFANLSTSAVRLREYSRYGFSISEVTRIIIFTTVGLWLGILFLGGTAFLLEPVTLPDSIPLGAFGVQLLGGIAFIIPLIYLGCCFFWKQSKFPFPSFSLGLAQLLISALDWSLASLALYLLIPNHETLSFAHFLPLYLISQLVGLVSHVPGGLGVFESMMLFLLKDQVVAPELMSALLAYRILYYFAPLLLGLFFLSINILQNSSLVMTRTKSAVVSLVPTVVGLLVAGCGVILIWSGSTPELKDRLHLIINYLPLVWVEGSHFLGSIVGVVLIILSIPLTQKIKNAFDLTLILLVLGIIFSLGKGWDYEEAIILLILVTSLIPLRKIFYRDAFLSDNLSHNTVLFILLLVIMAAVGIGLFSYKHVEYANELWWTFEFSKQAPRFLRATLGVSILTLIFGLWTLLRHRGRPPGLPTDEEIQKLKTVLHCGTRRSDAYLALLGDKRILYSKSRKSFLCYGATSGCLVAFGDPCGDEEEFEELGWRFRELCNALGRNCAFYQVSDHLLPLIVDLGMHLYRLGESAIVDLKIFTLEGHAMKRFRSNKNKFEKEGAELEIITVEMKERMAEIMPDLKSISNKWLQQKDHQEKEKEKEKGFSVGYFDEKYLSHFDIAIVRHQGKIIAFANLLKTDPDPHFVSHLDSTLGRESELSVDLMRYGDDALPGTMDFLFIKLMEWGKEKGFKQFDLGMAPLSGMATHRIAPMWDKVLNFIYEHGNTFYHFQGLRQYKEKYDPRWEGRYLAVAPNYALMKVLIDTTILISKGGGK